MVKTRILFTVLLILVFLLSGCEVKEDNDDDDKITPTNNTNNINNNNNNNNDNDYSGSATIPRLANNISATLPDGFKEGGEVLTTRGLDDPWGDPDVAPDPTVGNILWLVWNLDYDDYCTDEKIDSGDCFKVRPSTYHPVDNDIWSAYRKPAPLTDPDVCVNGPEDSIYGTSMISVACNFEYILNYKKDEIDACYNAPGKEVDITEYIPWAASWGIPTTVTFQGSLGSESYGNWYGLNQSVTGADGQYLLTLSEYSGDTRALEAVYLDKVKNEFFHLHITGGDEGSTQGIKAYMGGLPDASGNLEAGFEAIQILDYNNEGSMAGESFTIRMKSDGTYIWIQKWMSSIPGDDDFDADVPISGDYQCAIIEDNLPTSMNVDASECLTAFGKTTIAELNDDDWYSLKLTSTGIEYDSWFYMQSSTFDPVINPVAELNQCYDGTE